MQSQSPLPDSNRRPLPYHEGPEQSVEHQNACIEPESARAEEGVDLRACGATSTHSVPTASRGTMPLLSTIAAAWEEAGDDSVRAVLPHLRSFEIGWGEPFCFRCGWIAPGPEAADYAADWSPKRALDAAWAAASGWLERAHLHDHQHGGGMDPLNIVPLCPLCHERQPASTTREAGLAYVNEGADLTEPMATFVQVFTDTHFRGVRRPGKQRAVRSLLRARAVVATELLNRSDQLSPNRGALPLMRGAR